MYDIYLAFLESLPSESPTFSKTFLADSMAF